MTSGIYTIRCKVTEKVYVGSSKKIETRWLQHKYQLRKGIHHSKKLQHAWNKYGEDAFEFVIVEEVIGGLVTVFEQTYINSFNSCQSGYNILRQAGSTTGAAILYSEAKERVNLSLTPTCRDNLDTAATAIDISRSELIERLGRKGVEWLIDVGKHTAEYRNPEG